MTIEEIFPHIYRAEIPLPQNPLKATNSYVIRGEGRYLVIDTGMNREECRKAMENYLSTLAVDLNRTDFFITHLHADHFGLVAHLPGKIRRFTSTTRCPDHPGPQSLGTDHGDGEGPWVPRG